MSIKQRIAITGMGGISAAGRNIPEILDSFEKRRRNAGPVSKFSTDLSCPVFEIKNFPNKDGREGRRTLDLVSCAVDEALNNAGLQDGFSGLRVGVCFGTTVASQLNDIDFYRAYRNSQEVPMHSVERFLKGNLAEVVAHAVNAEGPYTVVVNACSSGADAIGLALSWLRNGICDIALAGGADELNLIPLAGFGSLGITSNYLCAPFDRDRKGLNLGEGAGVLIIETESTACKRGRKPVLFLAGYGSASDAYHLTAPRPDGIGLEFALHRALAEAKIEPKDICFVNAHGTATRDNDKVEGGVLARVFGQNVKFLSTKGFTGHTLGAAGALEAVFIAAALCEKWIPASAGFVNKDDEIPITPVVEKTRINGKYAVSTSLAFGGNNTAIVIEKELPNH